MRFPLPHSGFPGSSGKLPPNALWSSRPAGPVPLTNYQLQLARGHSQIRCPQTGVIRLPDPRL
jgi:hypothetical protein